MDVEAMYKQALALLEQRHTAAARPLLEQILRQQATHLPAQFALGVCLFRAQDFAGAELRLRALLQQAPRHPKAAYYLGLTLERQGRLPEAVQAWRQALASQPDFPEAKAKLQQHAPPGPAPTAEQPLKPPLRRLSDKLDNTGTEGRLQVPLEEQVPLSGEVLFNGKAQLSLIPGYILLKWITPLGLIGGVGVSIAAAHPAPLIAGGSWAIIFGVGLMLSRLVWQTTLYTIYERRIELQRGILSREVVTIWLYEIEEVSYSQPLLFRLIKTALVTIQGEKKRIDLVGLGGTAFMRNLWNELRDASLVERRGMKRWWV